jgi:hypothetical protein
LNIYCPSGHKTQVQSDGSRQPAHVHYLTEVTTTHQFFFTNIKSLISANVSSKKYRLQSVILRQMAPALGLSTATLDPATLPQVSFARADDLLSCAAQLRTKAEDLKARAKENENKAKQLEDSAAEVQTSAEDDRDYVQAELDHILAYHGDVLGEFLLVPDNESEVKRLTANVEEGRAYVHEVVAVGEKLIQFKASKMLSNHQSRHPSIINLPGREDGATPGSQISSQTLLAAHASSIPVASTKSWQDRFNGLFRRQVLDVDHSAIMSLKTPRTSENCVRKDKEINGSLSQTETPDGHRPKTRNIAEASGTRNGTSTGLATAETLENVTLPVPSQNESVETRPKGQKTRKKGNATIEGEANESQNVHQSHVQEDLIPPKPSGTNTLASETLKRKPSSSELLVPAAKRRAKAAEPTVVEKEVVFNKNKTLARCRELMAGGMGMKATRKALMREMEKKVGNSNRISSKRKGRLVKYRHEQIKAMVEMEYIRTNNEGEGEAVVRKTNEPGVMEEAMVAVFDYPQTLARYREAFTDTPGDNEAKRRRATKVVKEELNGKMDTDNRILSQFKLQYSVYAKQQVDEMAAAESKRMEANRDGSGQSEKHRLGEMLAPSANEREVEADYESGADGQLEDFYPAKWSDESADDMTDTRKSKPRYYTQLEDLSKVDLSDESADEAMWP